jgi:hypothetical protein
METRSLVVPTGFIPLSYVESFSAVGLFGPNISDENTVAAANIIATPKTMKIGRYSRIIFEKFYSLTIQNYS